MSSQGDRDELSRSKTEAVDDVKEIKDEMSWEQFALADSSSSTTSSSTGTKPEAAACQEDLFKRLQADNYCVGWACEGRSCCFS